MPHITHFYIHSLLLFHRNSYIKLHVIRHKFCPPRGNLPVRNNYLSPDDSPKPSNFATIHHATNSAPSTTHNTTSGRNEFLSHVHHSTPSASRPVPSHLALHLKHNVTRPRRSKARTFRHTPRTKHSKLHIFRHILRTIRHTLHISRQLIRTYGLSLAAKHKKRVLQRR